ncbi:MAG: PrgI family protein [Candidatus Saccharibacteria bacterium]|nr:PrgI family protein [Candidatus Saccharibacteria bacterium]
MKQSIPVEVFKIEDRVFGNLTIKQLIILGLTVGLNLLILGSQKFSVLTPSKIILMIVVSLIGFSLAMRFQKRLGYQWLLIWLNYYRRSHLYLKNLNPTPQSSNTDSTDHLRINLKPRGNIPLINRLK